MQQTKEIKLFGAVIKRVVVQPPFPNDPSSSSAEATVQPSSPSPSPATPTRTSNEDTNTHNHTRPSTTPTDSKLVPTTNITLPSPSPSSATTKTSNEDAKTRQTQDRSTKVTIKQEKEVKDVLQSEFKGSRGIKIEGETRRDAERDRERINKERDGRDIKNDTRGARDREKDKERDNRDRDRDRDRTTSEVPRDKPRDYRERERDRERDKEREKDKDRERLREADREIEKLRAKDRELELEASRLRARLKEREADIDKLIHKEADRINELNTSKEQVRELERYKARGTVFESIVEKHKREAEEYKSKHEKLMRDALIQKRSYDEHLRRVAHKLMSCEAFITEVHTRVQDVRNNVEEQAQFAKTPEIRTLSEEFITLTDTLRDFLAEGVKAFVGAGSREMAHVGEGASTSEGYKGGTEAYDPSLPTIERNDGVSRGGGAPMIIDSPNSHDLKNYVADFYNSMHGGSANNNNINNINNMNNINANNISNYPNINPVANGFTNVESTYPNNNSLNSSYSSLNELISEAAKRPNDSKEVALSNRLLVEGLGKDSQTEAGVWKYLPDEISPLFTTIGHRGFSQIAFQNEDQAILSKAHIEVRHPHLRVKFVPVENHPNLSRILYVSQLDRLPSDTTLQTAVSLCGESAIVKHMQGGDAAYAFVYFEDHEAAARAKKYLVDSFPILKVGFYMKNSLFEINAKYGINLSVQMKGNEAISMELSKGKVAKAPISVTMSAVPSDSLYLSDIALSSKEMRAELANFGVITFYQKRKSTAIVRFEMVESAVSAKEALGTKYNTVFVEPIVICATPNKKRKLEEGGLEESAGREEAAGGGAGGGGGGGGVVGGVVGGAVGGEGGGEGDGGTGITVLYVGGLDISFTSRHLPPLLEEFQPESILLHVEKACAFIYLRSSSEAQKAIKKLRHNLPANVGYGNKSNKQISSPYPFRHLWIDCIDPSLPGETIVNEFAAISPVQSFKRGPTKETAILHFSSPEEAGKACKAMQGKLLGKSKIQIFFVKPITAMG